MFDRRIRPRTDMMLQRLTSRSAIPPIGYTVMGLFAGLAAAVAAADQRFALALGLFVVNRVLDGLDGAVARSSGRTSDAGGYLDMMADVTVYAAIPLGVAVSRSSVTVWVVTAFLLASFYLNTVSWAYLSALLERRGQGAIARGETTSITMPAGLVEGAETAIWFAVILLFPGQAEWTMGSMAVAVAVGASIRTVNGIVLLDHRADPDRTDTAASSGRAVNKRWAVVGLWLAMVAAAVVIGRAQGLSPIEVADRFGSAIAGNWWGPIAFVVAYAARPFVAFPGSVLTVLGGVIFGPVWGTVWVVAGANASAAITYGAGRFVGGDRSLRRIPPMIARKVDAARERPFVATLVMRLLYLPFDAVGWVGGFARLPFGPFLAGSALGTLPGIVSFVGFGASIDAVGADQPSLDLRLLVASLALAVAGVWFARMLGRRDPFDTPSGIPLPEPAPGASVHG